MSRIIYISPHLDDVALSCGGLIWEQAQTGNHIEIWTICAGDPPNQGVSFFAQELHRKWGVRENAYRIRREEDMNSCAIMGSDYVHWDIQDCIYRLDPETGEPLYDSEAALRSGLSEQESPLIKQIASRLISEIFEDDILIGPLGVGGHVDHILTRRALEATDRQLVYYQDYPYILKFGFEDTQIPDGYKPRNYTISDAGLEAWYEGIAAHRSQISTFWTSSNELRIAIRNYYFNCTGISLWEKDWRST